MPLPIIRVRLPIQGYAAGSYELWSRWGDDSCPVDLGTFTIADTPVVTFDTQPTDQTEFVNGNATFSAAVDNADVYQWQISTDGGSTFSNISNGADYSGTQTTTLTVLECRTGSGRAFVPSSSIRFEHLLRNFHVKFRYADRSGSYGDYQS